MAAVRIYIVDDKTLKGIPGALLQFLDYDGVSVVTQYTTDGNGVVTLDSTRNSFELEPGRQVIITADGYGDGAILGGNYGIFDGYEVDLTKQPKNFPWWLLAAGAAAAYLAAKDRKKQVGGFGNVGILGVIGVALAEALEPRQTTVKF